MSKCTPPPPNPVEVTYYLSLWVIKTHPDSLRTSAFISRCLVYAFGSGLLRGSWEDAACTHRHCSSLCIGDEDRSICPFAYICMLSACNGRHPFTSPLLFNCSRAQSATCLSSINVLLRCFSIRVFITWLDELSEDSLNLCAPSYWGFCTTVITSHFQDGASPSLPPILPRWCHSIRVSLPPAMPKRWSHLLYCWCPQLTPATAANITAPQVWTLNVNNRLSISCGLRM